MDRDDTKPPRKSGPRKPRDSTAGPRKFGSDKRGGEASKPFGQPAKTFKPRGEGPGRDTPVQHAKPPFRPRPDGPRKPYQGNRERPLDSRSEAPKRSYGSNSERPRSDRPAPFGDSRPTFRPSADTPRKPFAGSRDRPAPRISEVPEPDGERIAKRLARAGIASRRDAEALVADGRVRVNGKVLSTPAFNVLPQDRIELDGQEIPAIERTRLFLFHKPAGVVTTNRDPEGRRTVFDVLPKELPRLVTIGRLDINTEGLLLLTNDGGLARVLELPATGWLRRYRVRVHGKVDADALPGLKDGMAIDGVFYGSIEATLDREQGANAWMTIGLREGKNREVKNILGALGLEVTRLIRLSYGPFQLGDLAEGHVHELKGKGLRDQLGERLIEEAGANFEAPIATPFSNKAEAGQDAMREERPVVARENERGREGEGGLIKKRRFDRDDRRENALGKLQTKDPRGGKPQRAGKPTERVSRPAEPPSQRKANVWMAPGARPLGAARVAAKAEAEAGRAARKRDKPGFEGQGDRDRVAKFGPRQEGDRPKRTEARPRAAPGEKRSEGPGPRKPFSPGSRGKAPGKGQGPR